MTTVRIDDDGEIWTVTIDRPEVRTPSTARRRVPSPMRFAPSTPTARRGSPSSPARAATSAPAPTCAGVAIGSSSGGRGGGDDPLALALDDDMAANGPMGPSRLELTKPVIAAVEGYAVAGGIELALWCDLRVAAATATFGVFCRRFGVPLIDGGTVRLTRLIGESRAMDLILTGRAVGAAEALALGLANRVVADGEALPSALRLAREIAAFPQECVRNDRASARRQHGLTLRDALAQEFALGRATLASGEAEVGARRFVAGTGKHGQFGAT
jgi:enoyl-CoA hydratase